MNAKKKATICVGAAIACLSFALFITVKYDLY